MTLHRWLLNYPLSQEDITKNGWESEWKKFKEALRKYWTGKGVTVGW